MDTSHVAFSDESYITASRFRGLAVVSLPIQNLESMNNELLNLLVESGVSEFKWVKLKTARMRLAAEKLIDRTILWIKRGRCRMDVLVWDTQDKRHSVKGRDDMENLKRMYYHLLKNVMKERWGPGTTWRLHPDEHESVEWEQQKDFLKDGGLVTIIHPPNLFDAELALEVRRLFSIEEIVPTKSENAPLVQLADLFAGLSVFSRAAYNDFERWEAANPVEPSLFETQGEDGEAAKESNSEKERFALIRYLNGNCKANKLGVSLKTSRGFKTMKPLNPLNIWIYESKHDADIAPVKKRGEG